MSLDEMPGKRKLKIDMNELELAFDNPSFELSYYLDLETGEVLLVTDETRRMLERIYEELPEETNEESGEFEAIVSQRDLPDWIKEALVTADMVESGFGDRFIAIPRTESGTGYGDMEDFIDTVRNQGLQRRLAGAIRGRGAFRRFKDVLRDQPAEEERWFRFRDERARERILEWLEDEGIEPQSAEG